MRTRIYLLDRVFGTVNYWPREAVRYPSASGKLPRDGSHAIDWTRGLDIGWEEKVRRDQLVDGHWHCTLIPVLSYQRHG